MRPPAPPPAVPFPAPPLAEMMPVPARVNGVIQRLPPEPPPLFSSPSSPLAESRPFTVSKLVFPMNDNRKAPPPPPPSGVVDDPLPFPPPLPTDIGAVIDP